jgi:hypothetical protein
MAHIVIDGHSNKEKTETDGCFAQIDRELVDDDRQRREDEQHWHNPATIAMAFRRVRGRRSLVSGDECNAFDPVV